MHTPTYTLSNRQRKELFERDYSLYLAIPDIALPGDVSDLVYRLVPELEEEPRPRIIAAQRMALPVDPAMGGGGLNGMIGKILTADEARDCWHVMVQVITAEIATRTSRRSDHLWQWPASVTTAKDQRRKKAASLE